MSQFRIRIEDIINGRAAHIIAGGKGEQDLVDAITDAVISRSVGMLRTTAQVERAVREGIEEVLLSLKQEVVP
jgi:hypothetical protein